MTKQPGPVLQWFVYKLLVELCLRKALIHFSYITGMKFQAVTMTTNHHHISDITQLPAATTTFHKVNLHIRFIQRHKSLRPGRRLQRWGRKAPQDRAATQGGAGAPGISEFSKSIRFWTSKLSVYLQAARASIAWLGKIDWSSAWATGKAVVTNTEIGILQSSCISRIIQMVKWLLFVVFHLNMRNQTSKKWRVHGSAFGTCRQTQQKKICSLSSFGNHPELSQSLYLCLLLSRLKNRLPQAPTIRGRSASSALLRNQLGFPAQRTFLLKERQRHNDPTIFFGACHCMSF